MNYWFDSAAADHVCEFFEKHLRHSIGQWKGDPFVLLDWERDVLRQVFGWKRPDGTRRYRKVYIEIPKKNGKSTLCAGLELYMLMADGENVPEVYCVASDRKQASIVFNEAKRMAQANPGLRARLDIVDSTKRIRYGANHGIFEALSKETGSKEGLNVSCSVFDELHRQRNRDMWDTLLYGGAAREQPLHLAITTAGIYDMESIAWEVHDYCRSVLEGVIEDEAQFVRIWGIDGRKIYCGDHAIEVEGDEVDWTDPAVWAMVNPSLGSTIRVDDLAEACTEAKNSPAKQNGFRRYRLNCWVGQVNRWLDMTQWKACTGEVDAAALAGRRCWLGCDLSTTTDLTGLVLVFPPEAPGEKTKTIAHFFMPADGLHEKGLRDMAPYSRWVAEGWIHTTPGNVIDYDYIEALIVAELAVKFEIVELAFDPYNARQLATSLMAAGFECKEVRQGFLSLGPGTKELERLVIAGALEHGGNPVLAWMASNCAVVMDPAGNIKPAKNKSTRRIDGISALVTALARIVEKQDDAGVVTYTGFFGD